MMPVESELLLLLLTGLLAGLMDAAIGGGGLLQIPALFGLLPAGTPAATVLGTNKLAASWGTATATLQFARRIVLPWRMLLPAAALAFAAAYLGARLAAHLPLHYMKPAMLLLMLLMFWHIFWRKELGLAVRQQALTRREYGWGLLFGALIGFYDGLFGPGTGSLLAFVWVRFLAYDFITATAAAKVVNLTTNIAALSFFIPSGHILWAWALPLAAANLCGGLIGARLALWGGSRYLRYAFMLLLCVLMTRFGWDIYRDWAA